MDEDEDLHYAMARYVCQWLDERKMLWPFYRRWRDTFEKDPTGAQAFAEVVGTSPAEANVAWVKCSRGLSQSSSSTPARATGPCLTEHAGSERTKTCP